MTVKELKEWLEGIDDQMLVVVDGYEQGFAEDVKVDKLFLKRNKHGDRDGIYGRHDKPGGYEEDPRLPHRDADIIAFYIGYRIQDPKWYEDESSY